jgi:SAM-dependent methyltransferase
MGLIRIHLGPGPFREDTVDVNILSHLRSVDRSRYPELRGYSRDEIYADATGGGALFLAVRMARTMGLQPGQVVLDVGCGKGSTSVFLARHFRVQVVAVDLWTCATYLAERFSSEGYRHRTLPLNLDVTHELPFAERYFDAVFCMNSLSFYGGSVEFLQHLLKHLRPGGVFCAGMETLSREFTPEQLQSPPVVYHYNLPPPHDHVNVWEDDFRKMHSPEWWQDLFIRSGLVDVTECFELDDAVILYEDLIRYQVERGLDPHDVRMSLAQLEYGRANQPYKTLFVLSARKR